MWFAALGNYQHNPWFVHMISKVLQGCTPVIELLDEPALATGQEELVGVRSMLYVYDFKTSSTSENNNGDVKGDWWIRIPSNEYLPTLATDNPSLAGFIASHRYIDGMCLTDEEKCELLSKRDSRFHFFCTMLSLHGWHFNKK